MTRDESYTFLHLSKFLWCGIITCRYSWDQNKWNRGKKGFNRVDARSLNIFYIIFGYEISHENLQRPFSIEQVLELVIYNPFPHSVICIAIDKYFQRHCNPRGNYEELEFLIQEKVWIMLSTQQFRIENVKSLSSFLVQSKKGFNRRCDAF